jgi:uncharacterized protein GlcG (DUF336 family)
MMTHNRWLGSTFLMALAACLIVTAGASGQSKDSPMVTGEAAKRAVTSGEISGDAAAKVAQGCLTYAAQHNFAAAVFVLDPFGNVVHSHRMDGLRPDEILTAMERAKGALFSRNATGATSDVVASIRGSYSRGFDPHPGGVPIVYDSQMIGAIGVAGSDSLNADCARAGIAAVPGLTPPPQQAPSAVTSPAR